MFSLRFIVCVRLIGVFSMNGVWLGIWILAAGGNDGMERAFGKVEKRFYKSVQLIGFGHDEPYVSEAGFWLLM